MEVLEISMDDNEADTSQDEMDEEEETLKNMLGPLRDEKEEIQGCSISNNCGGGPCYTSKEIEKEFGSWERPPIPDGTLLYSSSTLTEQPEPFAFFMIDSLSTVTAVKHPCISLSADVQGLPLHNVIRLFGVTNVPKPIHLTTDDDFVDTYDGNEEDEVLTASVCCNVHGFLPYFYALPTGKYHDESLDYWNSSKVNDLVDYLNDKIKTGILEDLTCVEYHEFVTHHDKCIVRLEVLNCGNVQDKIYHFFNNSSNGVDSFVLKVYCSLPRFCWKAQKILELEGYDGYKFDCFETNINNNIRFLTDQNLPGCSWLEMAAGKYYQRYDSSDDSESPIKESYCQIEIDIHFDDILKLSTDHPKYNTNPPVRVLSFDIEVMVAPEDIDSPKHGRRQVIQIGNVLGNYRGGANAETEIIGKSVFVIGTCDSIKDSKVVQFYIKEDKTNMDENYLKDAEAAMLGAWRDFVIRMDPDIIIGYNIKKFDIPYLIDRAYVLNNPNASRLPFLGRMKKIKSQIRPVENYLKKVHPYDVNSVDIQGRVILDFYPILVRHDRRNTGQGYFKLSNVAKRFLAKKEEKQDVKYTEIEGLQRGTSATRSRLAHYCLQDSLIPFLLLYEPVPCRPEKVRFIELYCRKSQNGGNLLRYLLNKSMSYNEYFKQIRLQKNPGKVVFVPDTPSPKKFLSMQNSSKPRNCAKNLFNS